uniref:Uncharacterized protein n=1 Tax=Rhipicephalus pulchellus TaxID=72859 RepID=L7LZA6_RHIPC
MVKHGEKAHRPVVSCSVCVCLRATSLTILIKYVSANLKATFIFYHYYSWIVWRVWKDDDDDDDDDDDGRKKLRQLRTGGVTSEESAALGGLPCFSLFFSFLFFSLDFVLSHSFYLSSFLLFLPFSLSIPRFLCFSLSLHLFLSLSLFLVLRSVFLSLFLCLFLSCYFSLCIVPSRSFYIFMFLPLLFSFIFFFLSLSVLVFSPIRAIASHARKNGACIPGAKQKMIVFAPSEPMVFWTRRSNHKRLKLFEINVLLSHSVLAQRSFYEHKQFRC